MDHPLQKNTSHDLIQRNAPPRALNRREGHRRRRHAQRDEHRRHRRRGRRARADAEDARDADRGRRGHDEGLRALLRGLRVRCCGGGSDQEILPRPMAYAKRKRRAGRRRLVEYCVMVGRTRRRRMCIGSQWMPRICCAGSCRGVRR